AFPYTTLFRSRRRARAASPAPARARRGGRAGPRQDGPRADAVRARVRARLGADVMDGVTLSLHPYALPLTEPVVWGGVAQTERRGILVRAETPFGSVGWGDACPLPGFSRETLAETRDALDRAAAGDASALPPAAQFGLDLALADAAA